MNDQSFDTELSSGKRFPFGKNWTRFLETLSDARIQHAERATVEMLGLSDLRGKTFLDIGSGSGLFSLVAHRLGATVHSFDYDPSSVACTRQLQDLYAGSDRPWRVERGSALDQSYMESLGQFEHRLRMGSASPHRRFMDLARVCGVPGPRKWFHTVGHLQRPRQEVDAVEPHKARLLFRISGAGRYRRHGIFLFLSSASDQVMSVQAELVCKLRCRPRDVIDPRLARLVWRATIRGCFCRSDLLVLFRRGASSCEISVRLTAVETTSLSSRHSDRTSTVQPRQRSNLSMTTRTEIGQRTNRRHGMTFRGGV